MAGYVTTVRTPRPPEETFALMADLSNFEQWDPGVRRSVQVKGDGPVPDGEWEVTVAGFPRDTTLRYRTLHHEAPRRVVVRADSKLFASVDEIVVEPDAGGGSVVTYDAELTLNGPLRIFDLGLRPVFDRIGDRAAAGLVRWLDGERVANGEKVANGETAR